MLLTSPDTQPRDLVLLSSPTLTKELCKILVGFLFTFPEDTKQGNWRLYPLPYHQISLWRFNTGASAEIFGQGQINSEKFQRGDAT